MITYKEFELPGDLPLVSKTLIGLIYYSLLLRLKPIKQLVEQVEQEAIKPGKQLEQLIKQDDFIMLNKKFRTSTFFLRRILRSDRPCLRRTFELHRWCIKNNISSHLCVGVRKNGKDLESHAWLELHGIPFREDQDQLNSYKIIFKGH